MDADITIVIPYLYGVYGFRKKSKLREDLVIGEDLKNVRLTYYVFPLFTLLP